MNIIFALFTIADILTDYIIQGQEEDEIDASVRAVNELLGELPTSNSLSTNPSGITMDMRALLSVEHK